MIQYDSFMGPGQGYDESTPFLHLHPRYVRTYGFQQHSCRPARDKSDMVASREQPEEAICRGRISSNRYKIKDVATRAGWYMHGFVRHLLIFLGRKYTTSLDAMCGGVYTIGSNHISSTMLASLGPKNPTYHQV
jgi:hypothetical protein